MLGALIHCWVQLVEVSGREKTYSGSSIIIKIYPAFSTAIGGRDGMDGGGGHWMTHSNYRTRHHSCSPGASSLLGAFGGLFGWGKIVFSAYYNYKNLSRPFHCHWEAGWDGLQQAHLDDIFYL
jgi:hypothetical protein